MALQAGIDEVKRILYLHVGKLQAAAAQAARKVQGPSVSEPGRGVSD